MRSAAGRAPAAAGAGLAVDLCSAEEARYATCWGEHHAYLAVTGGQPAALRLLFTHEDGQVLRWLAVRWVHSPPLRTAPTPLSDQRSLSFRAYTGASVRKK